jgi:hypothetical protein
MENEDKIGRKNRRIMFKMEKNIPLSKKEVLKSDNLESGIDLNTLRYSNPKLVELESAPEEVFLDFLKNMKLESGIDSEINKEFYYHLKKEKGERKARKLFLLSIKMEFANSFKNRRFKSPPNVKQFIEDIKLLQRAYPVLRRQKLRRQKLKAEVKKSWKKGGSKLENISVTTEVYQNLYPFGIPDKRDLAKIRTKLKRARDRGFL